MHPTITELQLFSIFLEATRENSWPSRVQSYKGGENILQGQCWQYEGPIEVAIIITGSSVHNQHIECLWRDTFWCVCHSFYSLFYEMEEIQLLCPTDDLQLYSLHFTFIPILNIQLRDFSLVGIITTNGQSTVLLQTNFGFKDFKTVTMISMLVTILVLRMVELIHLTWGEWRFLNISTAQEHLLRLQCTWSLH